MRWIVATACILAVLAVLIAPRNTPADLSSGGWCTNVSRAADPELTDPIGGGGVEVGVVCVPARGAGPWGYWMTAHGICAGRGVELLARQFRTKPTPEAVALAYSRWMRRHGPDAARTGTTELLAVNAGCLQGFRGRL